MTWAKFRDKKSKKIFYAFNTNFDHIGKIARKESALLLLEKVKEIAGSTPSIITGDFNAIPTDEPIQVITDRSNPLRLTDTKEIRILITMVPQVLLMDLNQRKETTSRLIIFSPDINRKY